MFTFLIMLLAFFFAVLSVKLWAWFLRYNMYGIPWARSRANISLTERQD